MPRLKKAREREILGLYSRNARQRAMVRRDELARKIGHAVSFIDEVELGMRSLDVIDSIRILGEIDVNPGGVLGALAEDIRRDSN